MIKSSTEILREYAEIISEAESDWEPTEDNLGYDKGETFPNNWDDDGGFPPQEENSIDLPDESMEDDSESDFDSAVTNPVADLANDLHVDEGHLKQWLKVNNYELSPVGGLSNKQGNV